jgi:hypothetical protein
MKAKYIEGPEVAAKFEEAMKILFQTPKMEVEKKKENTSRKPEKAEED